MDWKRQLTPVLIGNGSVPSYRGPVQAVDTAPRTEAELLVSPACYCVHYHALSRVLAATDLGPPGNTVWSVDFTAVVDVENSMTFSG